MEFLNKNDRQQYFNNIRGILIEKNEGKIYCSLTINVGHENPRPVNLSIKKLEYDKIAPNVNIGDKVIVRFYLTSTKTNDRWYTFANLLGVDKDLYVPKQPQNE